MTVSFTSVVELRGVNPYIHVSRSRARSIQAGWRKPLPVVVILNGRPGPPWRANLMPVGDGSFYLYLHGAMRNASGASVGDTVRVEVAFDTEYRGGPQHPAPRWFTAALTAHPRAREGWRALPPSRQKEIVRYFVRLRSAEARARNMARALHVLSGGPGRFMGRAWVAGS